MYENSKIFVFVFVYKKKNIPHIKLLNIHIGISLKLTITRLPLFFIQP